MKKIFLFLASIFVFTSCSDSSEVVTPIEEPKEPIEETPPTPEPTPEEPAPVFIFPKDRTVKHSFYNENSHESDGIIDTYMTEYIVFKDSTYMNFSVNITENSGGVYSMNYDVYSGIIINESETETRLNLTLKDVTFVSSSIHGTDNCKSYSAEASTYPLLTESIRINGYEGGSEIETPIDYIKDELKKLHSLPYCN